MLKVILARIGLFFWIVAVWIFIGYLVNTFCFGATRKPARYKVAPTNCVVRANGTNCWVRYMKDNLLNTNLVIMCEPFDPPPAENNEEVENEN